MTGLTFGSYFSGGGLADVGARAAGFMPTFAVEGDPGNWEQSMRIADTYEQNLGAHLTRAAVQDVDPADLPRVDWFHASPVCKNASVANTSAGEQDVDIMTATATAAYIAEHRPLFVTIENVWAYRKFEAWHLIARELLVQGYQLRIDHINMADYGVPQTRKRMIVTAVLEGTRAGLLPSTHEQTPQPNLFGAGLPRWVSWYEAIEDLIPSLPDSEFAPWQLKKLPLLVAISKANRIESFLVTNQNDAPTGSPNRGARLYKSDVPVGTVLLSSATRTRIWSHGRVVKLTPRAIARLQSLPDSYILPEKSSDSTTLLGNGVPSLFMQRLGESFQARYGQD